MFLVNKKNSYISPLSNKDILNSSRSDLFDVDPPNQFNFNTIFVQFLVLLTLIIGIGDGSTFTCTVPVFQFFLCKIFLIVDVFIFLGILGDYFAK